MKKLFILIIGLIALSSTEVLSQDAPSGWTPHYGIRKWSENANPSADSLNQNWTDIDQILYDLIVNTDEDQMVIEEDRLVFSPSYAGTGTFTTTAEACTVTVANMTDDDVVVVTPISAAYNANDQLSVTVGTGSFIVTRNSDGTSGLTFYYIWVKK